MDACRILIADDHPLFREALHHVAQAALPNPKCADAHDVESALALVRDDDSFDLILLDLFLPGAEGFSCLIALRNKAPATPILIVSASDDRQVMREAYSFGAVGYLPKSADQEVMTAALGRVMAGDVYFPADVLAPPGASTNGGREGASDTETEGPALTRRQLVVLELLAQGKANKQIAHELRISEITVKAHVSAILRKLNVRNRVQAVIAARRLGADVRPG